MGLAWLCACAATTEDDTSPPATGGSPGTECSLQMSLSGADDIDLEDDGCATSHGDDGKGAYQTLAFGFLVHDPSVSILVNHADVLEAGSHTAQLRFFPEDDGGKWDAAWVTEAEACTLDVELSEPDGTSAFGGPVYKVAGTGTCEGPAIWQPKGSKRDDIVVDGAFSFQARPFYDEG